MEGRALHSHACIRQRSNMTTKLGWAQSGELFDYIVEKGRLLEDEARHFFQQVPLFGFIQYVLIINPGSSLWLYVRKC